MDVFNPSSPLETPKVEWGVVTPPLADSLVSRNDPSQRVSHGQFANSNVGTYHQRSTTNNDDGDLIIPDFVMVDPKTMEKSDANEGISTKDLLKIRPPMKFRSKKVTPEEQRDAEYYRMRLKNTTASRRSREKKRQIDEGRVILLKELIDKVAKLEAENVELRRKKAKRIEVEKQCKHLQKAISEVGSNENNMVKHIKQEKMWSYYYSLVNQSVYKLWD